MPVFLSATHKTHRAMSSSSSSFFNRTAEFVFTSNCCKDSFLWWGVRWIFFCEVITGIQLKSWSKCREQITTRCPAPAGTSTLQLLYFRLRDHRGGRGRKIVRFRRTESLLWGFCLLKWQRSYTHEVSLAWMPKQDPKKDETNRSVTMEGKILWRLFPTLRITDSERMLRAGAIVFPKEQPPNCLSNTTLSSLK